MKAPTEPIEILHMIVRMLTREGRVSFDIKDDDDKLTVSINTINREYGRLLGGGGQAIRDINTLAKAMMPFSVVILEGRADDEIQRSDDHPCQILDLLKVFIDNADALHGAEIEFAENCASINTQCQDDPLLAAIDRTFYNIGRAQRGLFRVAFSRQ